MLSRETNYTKKIEPAFTDARGSIFDIVEEPISHVGYITIAKGAVRGNHYHKISTQFTYVLRGSIKFITTDIEGKNRQESILEVGDFSSIPPGVVHAYVGLADDSAFLDMTTLARGEKGYEDDTVRVSDRT